MFFAHCILAISIVFDISANVFVSGQIDDATSDKRGSSRAVNLLVINEKYNDVANRSIDEAIKWIREKNPGYLGKVFVVEINETDPGTAYDRICSTWQTALEGDNTTPDLVLDVTTAGEGVDVSNAFTASLGLPTLSAQYGQEGDLRSWRNISNDAKGYLIQVMPPADMVPELIREFAIELNVSNAAILFDNNFVMDHKYKSLLLNVPTRHVIGHVAQTNEELKAQLDRLRDLDVVNFFILADETTTTMVLETAKDLNFVGRKYGWFVLTLEEFLPTCKCQMTTVLFAKPQPPPEREDQATVARPNLPRPFICSAFYYDLTRLGVLAMKSVLEQGNLPRNLKHIDCATHTGTNTPRRGLNFLENLKTVSSNFSPTYADFKWGEKNGEHHADFNMSIHSINIEDSEPVEIMAGIWPAGINSKLQAENWEALNMTAVTSYRIVTVIHPPFVMYDNKTEQYYGFCIDLLNDIRETVKFEYVISEVKDGEYGRMDENGTWNGMIKELIDKKADVALGSLWVMAEREKVVDFTVPYYDLVGLTIMMLKSKQATSLFKFLTVLENEVWYCILGAYFLTSFLMWAFDRWSPYSFQNNQEKYKNDDEKRVFNLRECLWFCMTSLTPQGGGEAPKNLSGRLVAATWWLFGFIIIASYTANLAAFLTVSRLDTPIESLADLSKQYKVQYAPALNSPAYTYFERMANIETRFYEIWKDMSLNDSLSDLERSKLAVWDYPVSDRYTKMFQAMKEAGFPEDDEEAVRRVRRLNSSNEFAYIADASTIKYLVMTNCDLTQVGDEFSRKPYAMAVQQGSPLKDQLNNAILLLLNRRKLEIMKEKWWKTNPMKMNCEKEDNQSDGISIHNIGGVFIVILVGIVLACCTLAFEYWWYRYRPRISEIKQPSKSFVKGSKVLKPLRFNMRPAPTHRSQPPNFGSRF